MGDSLSARAKALITAAEKASIGPWELRREDVIGPQSAKFPHRNPSFNRIHVTSETGPDDGAFIATARNDAPDVAKAYLTCAEVLRELVECESQWSGIQTGTQAHELNARMQAAWDEARAFLARIDTP